MSMCVQEEDSMNEAQRKVLRSHHGDILKNLILDTDILGALLQKDVLSETMVQNIQAKPSQHEKIVELLFILPKRGPKAFPVFMDAVRKHSSFLADKLEQEYEKEKKAHALADEHSKKSRKSSLSISESSDSAQHSPKHEPHRKLSEPHVKPSHTSTHTPETQDNVPPMKTSPIKDQADSHLSRISVSSSNHVMTSNIIQQNLNNLYTKLRSRLNSKSDKEPSFSTPEPATFKMVDKLIEELFESLDQYEMMISQCQSLVGGRDRNFPLTSHIINLQKSKRELEQDLKAKEQQKNKYGDHISKLENRCRNQTTEITHLNEEIRKLKEDNQKLEEINCEREEKQKIIDDLRKMVMDADTSKKSKLRSSYLALHYDSNVSEIKQLRAECKNLKIENQSMKTENLMLKKSENLKKLAKLREDASSTPIGNGGAGNTGNGNQNGEHESREVYKAKQRPAGYNPAQGNPNMQMRGGTGAGFGAGPSRRGDTDSRRGDTDKPIEKLFHQSKGNPYMRGTLDNDEDDRATGRQKDRDKEHQELDFKFSNNNGSLGQKRTMSKDRSNKRVTFSNDYEITATVNGAETDGDAVRIPTGQNNKDSGQNSNSNSASASNDDGQSGLQNKGLKQDKRGRLRLINKGKTNKRSASMNNVSTSNSMIKMSSQLIQKSRNLRGPIGH